MNRHNKEEIVKQTEVFIQSRFSGDSSGHDWWHIHRVRNLALELAKREHANTFVVEMAALLHDLDDWKLNRNRNQVEKWLSNLPLSGDENSQILDITRNVSFKGAGVPTPMTSIEGKVVQDADRLDAIGAIGIARTFAYGGSRDRLIYHPDAKPEMHQSFESYQQNQSHTINHFYEKLLLLKDRMQTQSGYEMALRRHQVMEDFLDEFFKEWDGVK
ncbi:HD domain-containing protein [Prolixibacter denitrificans]|uniref:Phosphohydrolase n=1 Tax=Prolixibacter denitrificans TaxID=1541063 RepID=A0A2P8CKI9_9BACT|nr:HD domain-containing protein [Prolixibacter denitrificans]PSK85488.1 uncharacterized protein CLV93_101444 [Prolixibacter denitrificans]GET20108.1 phosphohydrolase [Prolixibacter denitrificans]